MKVFHGTTLIVDTPLVGVGRKNLDFGEGFYLTSIRQQAIEWAQRPINKEKPQYLNCYELDICEISKNNYRYLKFGSYDDAWLDFVADNRMGVYSGPEYDLVFGPVANDDVYETLQLYVNGAISREYTMERLKIKELFNQLVFKTDRALAFLRFVRSEVADGRG